MSDSFLVEIEVEHSNASFTHDEAPGLTYRLQYPVIPRNGDVLDVPLIQSAGEHSDESRSSDTAIVTCVLLKPYHGDPKVPCAIVACERQWF